MGVVVDLNTVNTMLNYVIEYGIFGELRSQIFTNQKQENSAFSFLIG